MKVYPIQRCFKPLSNYYAFTHTVVSDVAFNSLRKPPIYSLAANIVSDSSADKNIEALKDSRLHTVKAPPCKNANTKINTDNKTLNYDSNGVYMKHSSSPNAIRDLSAKNPLSADNQLLSKVNSNSTKEYLTSEAEVQTNDFYHYVLRTLNLSNRSSVDSKIFMSACFFLTGILLMFYLLHLS